MRSPEKGGMEEEEMGEINRLIQGMWQEVKEMMGILKEIKEQEKG